MLIVRSLQACEFCMPMSENLNTTPSPTRLVEKILVATYPRLSHIHYPAAHQVPKTKKGMVLLTVLVSIH